MNIEPLKQFLEQEMPPHEVAALIDEMLFEYIECIVIQQLSDTNPRGLHGNTLNHLHILRRLRDVFAECQSA